MLDVNLIQSTSSWPFVEIRKLLKERKDLIKTKNKIIGNATPVKPNKIKAIKAIKAPIIKISP